MKNNFLKRALVATSLVLSLGLSSNVIASGESYRLLQTVYETVYPIGTFCVAKIWAVYDAEGNYSHFFSDTCSSDY